ncbi:MAG TPA: sialidase family protein [Acidimicrobiales bacterium]|nr:sialidase family protein [Acidimicrobiales bacterium]
MRKLKAVAHALVLVLVATTMMTTAAPRAAAAVGAWEDTDLLGGGFVNVVSHDPQNAGVLLSGGDVSGVRRSTDGGVTWKASHAGLQIGKFGIASFLWHPSVAGKVYMATGAGASSGLAVSTNGGQSWTTRSSHPRFEANILPKSGRAVGRLLAIDTAVSPNRLYAGTTDQGVLVSTDDGATWTSAGSGVATLNNRVLGLALDPNNPNSLYVATNSAVYKSASARTGAAFSNLNVPAPVALSSFEELAFVDKKLYIAAGFNGVLMTADGGSSFSTVVAPDGSAYWLTVAGYGAGANAVVFAGCDNPAGPSGAKGAIVRSVGGAAFDPLVTSSSQVKSTIGGPDGREWWLDREYSGQNINGVSAVVNSIAVDPIAPARVIAAGRAGVFGSADSGATFYPLQDGQNLTVIQDVFVDQVDGTVYNSLSDWVLLTSQDRMNTVRRAGPGAQTAYTVTVDRTGSAPRAYVAAGDNRSNIDGEIFSQSVPVTTSGWVSEGFRAASGGKRPRALAVQTIGGSAVQIAAVQAGGMWRKVGTGSWTRTTPTGAGQPMVGAFKSEVTHLLWESPSSPVFLLDGDTGLWRSTDAGVTWTRIMDTAANTIFDATGYVVADPADPNDLYLSVGTAGVMRLKDAHVNSFTLGGPNIDTLIPPTGSGPTPGPVAVDRSNGVLYLATTAYFLNTPQLLTSTDRGVTWTNIADDRYRNEKSFATTLDVSPAGDLIVGSRGTGVQMRRGRSGAITVVGTAPTQVVEGAASQTLRLALTTAPTGNVEVSLTTPSGVVATPASLTFTPTNFATAQAVSLAKPHDGVEDVNKPGTVVATATSADLVYKGASLTMNLTVVDDDDITAPTLTLTTKDGDLISSQSVNVAGVKSTSRTRGSSTDARSGVSSVVVKYVPTVANAADEFTTTATLACDALRNSCTWSAAAPPDPGEYALQATARDVRGNLRISAPISIVKV